MSETLVLRVKRLVSGSVNSLVDAIENANPEVVMREALREIERATDEVRDELGRVIASRHQSWKLIEKTKGKLDELEQRASVAVEQGRDDLAEVALGRQLDLEGELPGLEQRLGDLATKQTELEGYVQALNDRKREMEADLADFLSAREAAAEVAGADAPHAGAGVRAERKADRAQKAFDRAMGGPLGTTTRMRADRETRAKLNELETVARSSQVADRLAKLKASRA